MLPRQSVSKDHDSFSEIRSLSVSDGNYTAIRPQSSVVIRRKPKSITASFTKNPQREKESKREVIIYVPSVSRQHELDTEKLSKTQGTVAKPALYSDKWESKSTQRRISSCPSTPKNSRSLL